MTNEETAGQLLAATKDDDTIEAAFFDRGPQTLTIADVDKGAIKGKKGKPKPYLKFANTPKKLFIPKITVICLTRMFGVRLKDWVGKRVVFHQSECKGVTGTRVPCVRVWGSPDIAGEIPINMLMGSEHINIVIRVGLPEKNAIGSTTKASETSQAQETSQPHNNSQPATVDPAVLEAWSILGWSREQGLKHMEEHGDGDYASHLNSIIDEMNAQEGTF